MSEDVRVYADDENKFKIEIPQGELNCKFESTKTIYLQFSGLNSILLFVFMAGTEWQVGTGESSGFKSLTAFFPKDESNSNGILRVSFFQFVFLIIRFFINDCNANAYI